MQNNEELQSALTKKRVLSLLGIAAKSGSVASGEFSTEKSVKDGKACLVIVSEEASANTKKMFTNMCTFYEVPIYFLGLKEELGHAIGREYRASLAVNNEGIANSIEKYLKKESSK